MALSPERLARKIEDWSAKGLDYAVVQGGKAGLEFDKQASRARAPRRSGKLAGTIRVPEPRLSAAAKKGFVRLNLVAGNRSKANPVPYASVIDKGLVGYPPKPRTKPHAILAQTSDQVGEWVATFGGRGARFRSFTRASGKILRLSVGGKDVFAKKVNHPGSRFRARHFMAVDEGRVATYIDRALQAGIDRGIG